MNLVWLLFKGYLLLSYILIQGFLVVDLVEVFFSMKRLEGLVMAVMEEETITCLTATHMVLPTQTSI